ncbi:ABC transporter [Sterolibacterium denitrificans]|uniref:ABC transporter n=1 Tax=Sterolibacterium denitrificans TaxID=157592 RepID=A0A7Z7MW63_9PROT|nr:ABC transporter ATP-binding protein [Sterolibacterium denitrificans]SMB28588.1 ABC transporter [Sterolibacterium denitrificans]
MTKPSRPSTPVAGSPDADLPPGLAEQLAADETVLAWLITDLDGHLHYRRGGLVVTSTRFLAWLADENRWQAWPWRAGLQLRQHDHAGVARLELIDAQSRLACWHHTLALNPAARHLLRQFERSCTHFLDRQAWAASNGPARREPGETEETTLEAEQAVRAVPQTESLAPPSTWTLLRLWRFAKPYQGQLLAGFLLTLASTAAALVPPYLSMPLMDNVLIPYQNGQPIDNHLVLLYLSGLFAAALLAWGLGWAKTYILALVSERIGADLRIATFDHLLRQSLEYFGGKRTGDLMARIGSESDRICVFLSLHLLDFATDVLMMVMTAVILFSINPWLALATLLPLPLIVWLIHQVRDRLRSGFEKANRIWSEVTNVLADTIPGVRVVKAFAQEEREVARFREANQHNLLVNDRVNKVWSLFSPSVTLLTEIGLLVVWGCGIWLVAQDQISVGVLTAFIAYIGRFYTRLDSMSRIVSVTQKAAASAKRIFEILDHVSSVPEPAQPVPLAQPSGHIELRNVHFRYGHRDVIHGLDFRIQAGEMIGVVGHSGSGKSTLVNLICRFYDVTDGAILIDGIDIRSLALTDFRRHVGLVLQEPFLFFGTVAENIAYGRPQASREEIVQAARAAHAHEFILRLPQGYDSLLGERGQGLSGGERQRISIARALLIDPRILILDEATSSVDTETEKEIQQALDNLVRGRTTLAIAHRLSTLRRADRLVVLDRGRIVEVGDHASLMARQGAYWRLYQAQAQAKARHELAGQTETDDE